MGDLTEYGTGHCAVCDAKIRPGLLMCRGDWAKVPKSLQSDVYAQLRRWDRGEITLGELRDTQHKAVASVT